MLLVLDQYFILSICEDSANVPRRARWRKLHHAAFQDGWPVSAAALWGQPVPERLVDLQLLALHDWRVGLQDSLILTHPSPTPNLEPTYRNLLAEGSLNQNH